MSDPTAHAHVPTLDALLGWSFHGSVNAVGLPRALPGDFAELALALAPDDGLVDVEAPALRSLRLSREGRRAVDAILADLEMLEDRGCDPRLSCITRYPRDERGLPVSTDVLGFHVDRAPVEIDTWLCTYHGPGTELLAPHLARRRLDDPAVAAALREALGPESERWRGGGFDLHYEAHPGAVPYPLPPHHLWRLAVDWPGARVPPAVHRAPDVPGPRLLLIA